MDNSLLVHIFVSMFVINLPTLIVCAIAGIVLLARREPADLGSLWGLLGFGLALVLCVVIPLVQALVQNWVIQAGDHVQRAWVFTAASGLWSVLHAVVYVFLLMAIIAKRPTSPTPEEH